MKNHKSYNLEEPRVTNDFQTMINIIIFNSFGFFFLDFLIPYVTSQELGALVTFALINTSNLWIFAGLLIIDFTIVTTGGLILSNFISHVSKTHRGKIFGFQSTFSNFGAAVGPILGGILWDISSKLPFIVSILVELALILPFVIAIFYLKPHLAEKLTH
jgi:MFS family permease